MATLLELNSLFNDGDLLNKVEGALAICASEIATGGDTVAPYDQTSGADDKRDNWFEKAISNPSRESKLVLILILGKDQSDSVATIQAATDSHILNNVREAIDALARAFSTV